MAMVEIKELQKNYSWNKPALHDINLSFGPGEIIGLFGENGAGKTSLLKCILGLLRYDGTITLDGRPITRENIGSFSFATSEHSFFPQLTAEDHKAFYREHFEKFREKRFDALMDFFELPKTRKIKSFSTGQKNQFEVILALCQGADFILMDEPFAGNDIFNREDFYKVLLGILEPGETIILSTHLIEEISGFISRAVLIHKGQILADKQVDELEEEGMSLMDFVKSSYNYRADRVFKALSELSEEE